MWMRLGFVADLASKLVAIPPTASTSLQTTHDWDSSNDSWQIKRHLRWQVWWFISNGFLVGHSSWIDIESKSSFNSPSALGSGLSIEVKRKWPYLTWTVFFTLFTARDRGVNLSLLNHDGGTNGVKTDFSMRLANRISIRWCSRPAVRP